MSKSTQESLNEALSAAIDGEAEELELRRVLNAAGKDPELRAKWERMHLIGSVVRGEATRPGSAEGHGLDMGGNPAQGEASGAYLRRLAASGRWAGPVTGVAVAAAVVAAVALDTLDTEQPAVDTSFVAVTESSGTSTEVAAEVPSAVAGEIGATGLAAVPQLASVPSEADLARAREYLVQHAHQTSFTAPTPGMPHVKVLAVSSTESEER